LKKLYRYTCTSKMSGIQNMSYCGRMYQNPRNRTEIWINVGWNTKGAQKYPAYEPGLSEHISKDVYDEIIYEVRKEFENTPFSACGGGLAFGMCAMATCFFTCGICFCPCLYLCCAVRAFTSRVNNTMEDVGQRTGLNIQYRLIEAAQEARWMDSRGKILNIGPPLGGNVVITLPVAISWPPVVVVPRPVTTVPPTQKAYAPPTQPAYTAPTYTASAPPSHTASAPPSGYGEIAPPKYEDSAWHPPAPAYS